MSLKPDYKIDDKASATMKKVGFLLGAMALLVSSCTLLFKSMFGLRTLTTFDTEAYQSFLKSVQNEHLHITTLIADSASVRHVGGYAKSPKHHSLLMQPMQAYFFIDTTLHFFVANCMVPPKLPNLHWEYQGMFATFPPRNLAALDSINVSLPKLITQHPQRHTLPTTRYKYHYWVNWTLMTERQSRRLIKVIQHNILQSCAEDSTLLILNNTDDFYITSKVEF